MADADLPDPDRSVDLAEFIQDLNRLRLAAGSPSFRVLAKRVGPLLRPPQAIAHSTVTEVFRSHRRRLDVDLVTAVVRALGLAEPEVARWRAACIRVHAEAKTGGPAGVFGQLPSDLATFTGRREVLTQLIAAATRHHDGGANTVVISSIEGMAGVGKTQLVGDPRAAELRRRLEDLATDPSATVRWPYSRHELRYIYKSDHL
ncbi:hypothetical protein [Streptacidiphilus carbonis]|uniref:hypothetical protein n=1 Tax=Streptacidiphilus carbonis TaxID=105422 RepID=UPI0005A84BD9|nr:hypothetical protein [Streptacidiphilus carbonis]